MRIAMKIPINVTQAPAQRKTDPQLVQLAGTGERVLNELQGESGYEGEPCGRVVELMSFQRMVSLAPSHTSLFSVVLRTWRGDIVALWDDLASSDSHSALPDSCVHAPFRAPTCHSMGVPSIVFSAILSPPYRSRALTFLHSAYLVRKLT